MNNSISDSLISPLTRTTASTADKFLNTENLYHLLDTEPFLIISSLILISWGFYKFFLKEVSEERHKSLKSQYKNLLHHFFALSFFFALYLLLHRSNDSDSWMLRATPYTALISFFWGIVVLVKTCRVMVLQYLFLGSIRHGVPILIVNIFSLIFTLLLSLWASNQIFGLQLTPILATSAAFSVILGLAMQDTLGNLFAGISLQMDHNYDIGDWLEVIIGGQKIVGQVHEITWRATTLLGWTDEKIIIPNRQLANSQFSNFSLGEQPIVRSQMFRLEHNCDIHLVKKLFLEVLKDIPQIRQWPEPLVLISENNDSWILFKVIYYIDNYGSQYVIADQVVEKSLAMLQKYNIPLSRQKIQLVNPANT